MLGAIGAIAFIAIYNIATVLFIPASLLTLGGGAIYGLVWGSIYVFVAATLGATFAFLIGRYFARNWVSEKISKNVTFRAIDESVFEKLSEPFEEDLNHAHIEKSLRSLR
jgi:uncharacterized membrane protein YdjX (TVP38/TMEM64 family)